MHDGTMPDDNEGIKILKQRYANGEITKKIYLQMKEDLADSKPNKVTSPKSTNKINYVKYIVPVIIIVALIGGIIVLTNSNQSSAQQAKAYACKTNPIYCNATVEVVNSSSSQSTTLSTTSLITSISTTIAPTTSITTTQSCNVIGLSNVGASVTGLNNVGCIVQTPTSSCTVTGLSNLSCVASISGAACTVTGRSGVGCALGASTSSCTVTGLSNVGASVTGLNNVGCTITSSSTCSLTSLSKVNASVTGLNNVGCTVQTPSSSCSVTGLANVGCVASTSNTTCAVAGRSGVSCTVQATSSCTVTGLSDVDTSITGLNDVTCTATGSTTNSQSTTVSTTTISNQCSSTSSEVLVGYGTDCGQFTVTLSGVSQQQASIDIYDNGVLTNVTTVNIGAENQFDVSGTLLYVYVPGSTPSQNIAYITVSTSYISLQATTSTTTTVSPSSSCTAQSGFSCTNIIYEHSNNNIVATITQNTGSNWVQTSLIFLNSTNLSLFQSNGAFPTTPATDVLGSLNSGMSSQINLPVSSATSTTVDSYVSGQIWARYVISGSTYYSQIGTVSAQAV